MNSSDKNSQYRILVCGTIILIYIVIKGLFSVSNLTLNTLE